MENYYLFLDESGDHGLSNINASFPVFLLCGVLFKDIDYEKCRDEVNEVKEKFWGNKEVIFHSSDIRRIRKEFQIFFDLDLKADFISDINTIISGNTYTIIADGIHKEHYIKKYGKLSNVYELCLSFIIERAVFKLDEIPNAKTLYLVIEERGKKEDQKLKTYISKVLDRGTAYVKPERLKQLNVKVEFRSKKANVNGLQIADLVAYPIATHIINERRANPAFDILKDKFYKRNGVIYGLKKFP
ncbi:hypothetical protein A0256_23765 [Mucilaginibacter sp. PAMC 26640]|nr:hypothetical protein A0256_23765 [Mucilaginibacter sp. PAMC 26640]